VSLFLVAKSLVTAKAFWSVAGEGFSATNPRLSVSVRSAVTVLSTSGEASGVAFAPLSFLLRNSVNVPT